MNKEKYINNVLKNINCSKNDKVKIKEDLNSDIAVALDSGESWVEIKKRLGSPEELASELNENFDYPVRSNSKRNIFIGVFIGVTVVILSIVLLFNYFVPKSSSIDESKIFDIEVLNQKVELVIDCLNTDNYEQLMTFSNDLMKQSLSYEELNSAILSLGELGDFKSITRTNFSEVKNKKEIMAVGEIVALYEQKSVTYTISFDEDMKLAGLYMK